MSERMIRFEDAEQVAKNGIDQALREARVLAGKLAGDMAAQMERGELPSVTGPEALRVFAAALVKGL